MDSAWDMYERLKDELGAAYLIDEIACALDSQTLAEVCDHIARMHGVDFAD